MRRYGDVEGGGLFNGNDILENCVAISDMP